MKTNKGSNKMIHRKRKNSSVRPGMQMGELYVSKRVPTKSGSSGGQRWLCVCSCGKQLKVPQWYLVRNEFPKRHCGCKSNIGKNPYPRERGIWYMMHRRCYNSDHVAYKHYGGATPAIGVCDPWNKDVVGIEPAWEAFIKDMGPAPSRGHTLDRIDPYKGYGWQIGDDGKLYLNCRWATATEQMNNLKRHWVHPDERQAATLLAEKLEAEKFDIHDDSDEEEIDNATDNE